MWRAIHWPLCSIGILGLTLVGCGAVDVSADDLELDGTWQLESINSAAVTISSGKEMPFFKIEGSGVKGYDGCNRFFGSLDQPGAISSTRRACPDSTLKLPLDLSDLNAHLQTGCRSGDQLTIPARGNYPSSSYVRLLGASAAPGEAPSDTTLEGSKPGAEPSAASAKAGSGPDPHKRAGFDKVTKENKARLQGAEAQPGAKPGKDCGAT